ncbi:MAG: glycosyltransferase [Gammaproteobacteria bacterium]|nr:glycosyltransferase [Gammaproteobacteria bacterium]
MTKPRLTILGVQLESEAYPNVLHRVRALENAENIQVQKIHYSGWSRDTQSRSGKSRLLRNFWRMLYAHLAVLLRYLRSGRTDCTYIPYPATMLLWLLSLVPGRRLGTRRVADAFISLYDTIVLDRKLLAAGGIPAKLLYLIERRAFGFADAVIVDTHESAAHMADLFGLPLDSFVAVPLATDELLFQPSEYRATRNSCRVLFIGTLIPLHGVPTIIGAATVLRAQRHIELKVIGDGQENSALADYAGAQDSNLEWVRQWLDSAQIAGEIAAADVCLGIFGATEKTQRVLPFKLYAYSRIGRCIITAKTQCSAAYACGLDYQPWYAVPVADARSLAAAITEIADNEELRSRLAANAARFYREHLSNKAAEETVMGTLFPAPDWQSPGC